MHLKTFKDKREEIQSVNFPNIYFRRATVTQDPEVQFTYKILQSTFDQTVPYYFKTCGVQKMLSKPLSQQKCAKIN